MFRRKFWISLALSIPVLVFSPTVQGWLGYSTPAFPLSQWIVPVFSIIVFIIGGLPFFKMSRGELKDKQPGMMTLISLALAVAFLYSVASTIFSLGDSFYWELVTLIDVMLLGHWIEMRSVRQASGALDELSKLLPDTAERVNADGNIETVRVSELQNEDLVLIRPGASAPADGEIIEGQSSMDESMITGESKPVSKAEGDKVVSGTINGDGSLRVKVTAVGDETTLAGIMRLVEEAQQSKSKTQILADRAAGWLFYIALGVAALTAVAWLIAEGWNIDVLNRVTSVLVIACPHALGLAIPLVVAISTSIGASNGILIRDRVALEAARELDIFVFDKTGTLTKGEFGLSEMRTSGEIDDDRALALAAALEQDSEHPIAKAIRKGAEERGLSIPDATDFEAIKGKGVRAKVDDVWYHVGSPRLAEEQDARFEGELRSFYKQASGKGETIVFLLQGDSVIAAFGLADQIRPESYQAVKTLHDQGYEVAMMTGDAEAVAKTVADELGIDIVFAEVLPENKDEKIRQLQDEGKKVAMVGDGVNDAPALTRADVGIAIGSGTDVAIESAGIILVENDPMDIPRIVALSKATFKKMRQNLIWATGYNVIALPLAAGVLAPIGFVLPPAVGALIMSISTVIVAINAQLLRRV
ncbi:MAG: heavy metal translocating P-type ATPase, partial [Chloroflexota bacterium]|nr:heavy metal translocating P-type ATPase [Chloroflexota bacterium]